MPPRKGYKQTPAHRENVRKARDRSAAKWVKRMQQRLRELPDGRRRK